MSSRVYGVILTIRPEADVEWRAPVLARWTPMSEVGGIFEADRHGTGAGPPPSHVPNGPDSRLARKVLVKPTLAAAQLRGSLTQYLTTT